MPVHYKAVRLFSAIVSVRLTLRVQATRVFISCRQYSIRRCSSNSECSRGAMVIIIIASSVVLRRTSAPSTTVAAPCRRPYLRRDRWSSSNRCINWWLRRVFWLPSNKVGDLKLFFLPPSYSSDRCVRTRYSFYDCFTGIRVTSRDEPNRFCPTDDVS